MLHLITGGSGSGKSVFAEETIAKCGDKLYYIATMMPFGDETEQKIRRHQEQRAGKGFQTIECYTGLSQRVQHFELEKTSGVLLECLSNLVANELYQPQGAGENTVEQVMEGIEKLSHRCRNLVIVTNEVFGEIGNDSLELGRYKKVLAEINCRIAAIADRVTEVVYGQVVEYEKETQERILGMKLIIGGAYQGKLTYARRQYHIQTWIDGEDCRFEDVYQCEAIRHFEALVRRMMTEGAEVSNLAEMIAQRNPEILIISREIGCGLVPVDHFEREYREKAGRVCTAIAEKATQVDRVICGIGNKIKGEMA